MFRNRTEAGYLLAGELLKYRGEPVVVMAIPRGGLPLGAIIAESLHAPLDVALTKKIGHPFNREYAIGAVSRNQIVLSKPEGVSKDYIDSETIRLRKQLEERHRMFHRKKDPVPLKGKRVVIVDDGIATGNTLRVTIALIAAESPDKIIVAIPVAPPEALRRIRDMGEVDEVICLETPHNFHAVGQFYEDFDAVTDEEALEIFEQENPEK
ncbi:MAG: phosphoribosyltransferase family protein [Robiginitalea sp.]